MRSIPSLSSNFLQIPTEFVEFLLKENLSRNELLVVLRMAWQMYEIQRSSLFVSIDELMKSTGLQRDAVEQALSKVCERGFVLRFEVEGSPHQAVVYTLHTEETTLLADIDDLNTVPDETPSDHLEVTETAPTKSEEEPQERPSDSMSIPPTARSPVLWARVKNLIGREPTKDEHERLRGSGALDAELFEAMDSVESRKIQIYSTDQILYEYERIQLQKKTKQEQDGRRHDALTARQRTRLCTKCGGSGYIISARNSLKLCDCKK